MMLDRRGFISVSGSLVASSALGFCPRLLVHSSPGSVSGITPSPQVIFTIAGWNTAADLADPSSDQMLIRVNQCWRCAWR
jgi:hypothetical protein